MLKLRKTIYELEPNSLDISNSTVKGVEDIKFRDINSINFNSYKQVCDYIKLNSENKNIDLVVYSLYSDDEYYITNDKYKIQSKIIGYSVYKAN